MPHNSFFISSLLSVLAYLASAIVFGKHISFLMWEFMTAFLRLCGRFTDFAAHF
jgi:hypothetical protein